MLAAMAGLIAGFIHVLMGPDHLAAIAPMTIDDRRRSWHLGLRWGIGHSGGVLLVGIGVLAFREVIPVTFISSISERLVGLVLIGIGLWALKKAFDTRIHAHPHEHDGTPHAHMHVHRDGHEVTAPRPHAHTHTALAVGTLHGLAGSSHIVGIVPALALPTTTMAALYLIAFGVGTVAGMVCFSGLLGWIVARWTMKGTQAYRVMMTACAAMAIVVGGVWMIM